MQRSIMVKAAAPHSHSVKMVTAVKKALPLSSKQALLLSSHSDVKQTLTPFQVQVYTALCRVPAGRVTTYKHLAVTINCKSSQAVGQALRRNPYAPVIPCHRVVQSNGSIGGFFGSTKGEKIEKKIRLLESEGVRFGEDGKVDPTCIYTFSKE
jgi:methylated-DNA-[protein]-cysteine S-methyltransferase